MAERLLLRTTQSDNLGDDVRRLARELCVLNVPSQARDRIRLLLAAERTHSERALIALCPGCKTPADRWPTARFVDIAQRLVSTSKVEIVVLGAQADYPLGEVIRAEVDDVINLCGRLPIVETAAVLKECAVLVGLSTGTTHLAAAVGTPCVAIYGGRNFPGLWYPIGTEHVVLQDPVTCTGCELVVCPLADHPCVSHIEADLVWNALKKVAARRGLQLSSEDA